MKEDFEAEDQLLRYSRGRNFGIVERSRRALSSSPDAKRDQVKSGRGKNFSSGTANFGQPTP